MTSETTTPTERDPMQEAARQDRRRAFRVGLVSLIGLGILVALLVLTGPLAVVRGRNVSVDFAFAGPIKPGASVRISGVVVGAVQSVELLAGKDPAAGPEKMVRVHARIEERAASAVTTRARFRVTTLGVLGEHYLDVEPIAGGVVLVDGARVDGESIARADLLLARAARLLERADDLLPSSPEALALMKSAGSLLGRLDELLRNEGAAETTSELRALIADLRTVVHGAAIGIGDGTSLKRSMDRLPVVLDKAERLEDAVDPTDLGPLLRDARASLARLDRTLELVEAAPLLEPARQEQLRADVSSAMRSIDAVSRRADGLLQVVERGDGGAGQLFWDETAARDLRELLRGLRENPVRFFLGRGER